MKRHTNTKIKYFGIALTVATVVGGVVTFANPTWAQDKTSTVDLSFTVKPELTITVSDGNLTIGNLTPGNTGESSPVTVTVKTNDSQGCSVKATTGTSGSTGSPANTDLTLTGGGGGETSKFTQLNDQDSTGKSLSEIPDNQWGVAFQTNSGNFEDAKYFGFPGDEGDQGAKGKEILKVTSPGTDGNTVQVKVGAKAGAGMQPGTYTNQINFYAVTSG